MIKSTVKQLSERLTLMRQKIYHPSDNLQGKVLAAYRQRTIEELTALFLNTKPDLLIPKLRRFLVKNWDMIKGTSLSYTALPDNEITDFLCDIAQLVKNVSTNKQECALQILMPTLAIDSISPEYPALDSLDIRQVLKTYILGKEGRYLIPVQQLGTLQSIPAQKWLNCYFEYRAHPAKMSLLTQEEYERLGRHSPETIALRDAYLQYELSLNEQGSLLAHLKQLSRFLYFNSVNGIGKETNAGASTYDAIIQFNEYYSRLDDSSKKQIPSPVKVEIDLILDLSRNQKINKNATETMDTCIATRREHLEKAIKPVENILTGIGLSREHKALLTREKKQHLEHCQTSLKKALEKKNYTGRDSLGLTIHLIKTLNVEFSINSHDDIRDFMAFMPEELSELCKDEEIQKQFISQFKNIETLVFFIHETPIAQLKVILSLCSQRLAKKLVTTPEDFCALLVTLNKERSQIICQLMKAPLIALIKNAKVFNSVLEPLQTDQRSIIYQLIADHLPSLIKNGVDFNNVCSALSSDQRDAVYKAIKTPWQTLITTGREFKKAIEVLSPVQSNDVYVIMSHHWLKAISKSYDFRDVYKVLLPSQRLDFYNSMKELLPSLINYASDLRRIIQVLAPQQCTALYLAIKNQISKIIKNKEDLEYLFNKLTLEQCTILGAQIKDQLPIIIKNSSNIASILKSDSLTADKRKLFYNLMRDHFSNMIKTGWDFLQLLEACPEHAQDIFNLLKNHWLGFIKTSSDFSSALLRLSAEQRILVFDGMKAHLPKLIKNASDFEEVLRYLAPAQRTDIFKLMENKFVSLIQNARDLNNILGHLSPEQRNAIYKKIKENLPSLIITSRDFVAALEFLSPKQRTAIYLKKKTNLQSLLNEDDDFFWILSVISPKQCTELCSLMNDYLIGLLNNGAPNLTLWLEPLSLEQCTVVFEAIKDTILIPELNVKNLNYMLQCLSPKQCTALCHALKNNLAPLATTIQDCSIILEDLPIDKYTAVFLEMQEQLVALLKDSLDVKALLQPSSVEQCSLICKEMKASLVSCIKDSYDFEQVFEGLSPEHQHIVYNALKDHLPLIIKNGQDFNRIYNSLAIEKGLMLVEMTSHLTLIIKNSIDLKWVLQSLTPDQCKLIMMTQTQLPQFLKTTQDWSRIFQPLSVTQCETVCESMKNHLSTHIKDKNDLTTFLSPLSPNLYATLYKNIKKPFQQLVPVKELKEFLHTLQTEKQKKKVQQIFFEELLEKTRITAHKTETDESAKVANKLFQRLSEASRLFFVEEKIDYPTFKNSCQKAINKATALNYYFEWADLLATLVVTILSLGLIPVTNKLITGHWTFRLFKHPDELAVDNVLDEANQLVI